MSDAKLIAIVKEILFKDPEFMVKYGQKFAALLQDNSFASEFGVALESPLPPPDAEKGIPPATNKLPPKETRPLSATPVVPYAESPIVPAPFTTAPIITAPIVPATIVSDSIVSAPIVGATIDPSQVCNAAASGNYLDELECMDTSVPLSQYPFDSDESASASPSSDDDYQLVGKGGKRKKGKSSQANKAKKPVAATSAPASAPLTAAALSQATPPLRPAVHPALALNPPLPAQKRKGPHLPCSSRTRQSGLRCRRRVLIARSTTLAPLPLGTA